MEKIEIYPKVFLIEDFLKPDEVAALDARCRTATEEEWSTTIQKDYERMAMENFPNDEEARAKFLERGWDKVWEDKHLSIDECGYTAAIHERLYEVFDPELYEINSPARAQRQYPGTDLRVHYDSAGNDTMAMSIVLYINDDYNGGNLRFVDHDFEVKPKAGSLLVFPSTDDYEHGVMTVDPGPTRYAIPAFVFHKKGA
jgi:2OG-Fe(II) oxygenase superfamily